MDHSVEISGQVLSIPLAQIRIFPEQPREFFDQTKLKELAASIKRFGQRVPGFVKKLEGDDRYQYELVDGQRRYHAVEMAGIAKMKAIVVSVKDKEEQFLISVMANFGRQEHGHLEIAKAVARFKQSGMATSEIAEAFAKSIPWVYQYLKLVEKLDPAVQKMMSPDIPEDDRLSFSAAVAIADVPTDLQKSIADLVVKDKLKLIQTKDLIRRRGEKLGFKVGNKDSSPRGDYWRVRSFIGKMKRELEVFIDMPQSFFTKMFEFRDVDGHSKMVETIKRNLGGLEVMLGAIEKAKATQKSHHQSKWPRPQSAIEMILKHENPLQALSHLIAQLREAGFQISQFEAVDKRSPSP